jgi:hypothetical protein
MSTINVPVYRIVAAQFVDLHDTPGRARARDAIRDIVPWEEVRFTVQWYTIIMSMLSFTVQGYTIIMSMLSFTVQ